MEVIETIIKNARIMANAEVDWSLTAGPIWLAGMAAIVVVTMTVAAIQEVRAGR